MTVNILYREYKIVGNDGLSLVDISADVHVMRVFKRMGFVPKEDKKLVIEKAIELNPEYPGVLDFTIFHHGTEVCKKKPLCEKCIFNNLCPKNI
jgi:endonuclease III